MGDMPADLDVRATRKPIVKIMAGVGVLALAGVAVLVIRFATDKPYAKACDHLHDLAKTDPATPEAVETIVAWVQHHVVELAMKDEEHVVIDEVGMDARCDAAFRTLDNAMSHTPLMRKVDCVAEAKTAKQAAACF